MNKQKKIKRGHNIQTNLQINRQRETDQQTFIVRYRNSPAGAYNHLKMATNQLFYGGGGPRAVG